MYGYGNGFCQLNNGRKCQFKFKPDGYIKYYRNGKQQSDGKCVFVRSGIDEQRNRSFSGTVSKVDTVNLQNGTLVINNGKLYVSSTNSDVAEIYGTGTLQLNSGWIDSTGGNKLAGLTVGSGTVNLSYNGNDVNLGTVTYASADGGVLSVKGNGGEVSVDSYTAQSANNKLQVENGGTLNVGKITAYNINAAGSQYGTINVSGSGEFNGPVYLSALNVLTGGSITFGSGFEMHGALNIKDAANIGIRNKTYISDLGGVFQTGSPITGHIRCMAAHGQVRAVKSMMSRGNILPEKLRESLKTVFFKTGQTVY